MNWPNTWSNFPHTYMVYLMHKQRAVHGIGFVLTGDDPFVGLDLDHCINAGQLSLWAQDVLNQVSSYTEISPSGSGLRILVTATGFTENRRRDRLEIYSRQRFLTVTGIHVAGTPGEILPIEADQLANLIPVENQQVPSQVVSRVKMSQYESAHDELWARIFTHDRFGEQHRCRFLGDTSVDGGDHSFTVIRLLNTLARWTGGDAARMRATMSLSPLANDKWWSKRGSTDWLDCQIADAIKYTQEHRSGISRSATL